jgi:hypothetical protein
MFFEMAGFLCGMVGVGAALLLFCRRETGRVMAAINPGGGARSRG